MAYCTVSDLKLYQDITGTTDDNLLTQMIARAQAAIDRHTHRKFEHGATAVTRYYTVGVDTLDLTLYLDEDLCSISTVKTDADATSPTTISATEYVTEPRNQTPYHSITIKRSANKAWEYTDDPESGIEVSGKWAYSSAPPDDIRHACLRLASYYYAQKDAQVFDVTAMAETGVVTVPKGIPADVKQVLAPYVKRL